LRRYTNSLRISTRLDFVLALTVALMLGVALALVLL
jgi:hypothetical protein